MNSHSADMALTRLLRLASPMLPVGAYSYSQALESGVEQGWVHDAGSAQRWIEDVLVLAVATFEAPIWCRLYRAWAIDDRPAAAHWNATFLAAREAAELRAETIQMGYSLRALAIASGEFEPDTVADLLVLEEPAFPTVFSFMCARWRIPERQALLGYLWAWVENQVSAAMKAVPLGQTAGQALVAALSELLPAVVDSAITASDEDLSNCTPGFSIASCLHESQYSRLFRS